MPKVFQKLSIERIQIIAREIYLLWFSSAAIAAEARPGQFVMVRPVKFAEPLLPRPFSIHRLQGDRVELLFKVVGPGTRQLADLKKGDLLEVRGPLGRGYDFSADQNPILVAGGMGVAPLLFLAETWKRFQKKNQKRDLRLFIGARSKSELLGLKEFERTGTEIFAATEDGSYGRKGLVTRLLISTIKVPCPDQTLYVCGPDPMLKAIRNWAVQKGISCQLSLEARMACGLGACLGCVVAQKKETEMAYVNVCQQGPVFEARELLWDE
jgi:dihydroorotate dehydrogenase electron transfer subunit